MKLFNLSNIFSYIVYSLDFYKQPDSQNDPKQALVDVNEAPYLLNQRT